MTPPWRARARKWWPAAALAVTYLWCFPYFTTLRSANEVPRVLLAQELVRKGTTRLDARQADMGSRFDIATTPAGHLYSNKAPGPSLLGAPVVAVADAVGATSMRASTRVLRLVVVTLPCLAFLLLFFGLARRLAGEGAPLAPRAALVAYALGSMALPYGVLYYSHALAGALAGAAFVAAVRLVRGPAASGKIDALLALGVGAGLGAAILVDYQSVIAAAAVGLYVVAKSPRRWRHAALGVAGAVPPLVALLAYHAAAFGSPWKTGYAFAADQAHKQGFLGVIGPNAKALAQALITPDNGLFVLTPWVLVAVLGGVVVAASKEWRTRIGAEALVCAVIAVGYVLFVGSLVPEFGRAGWSVGPRYIGVAMPFVAWLAVLGFAWCEARPAPRALAGGLVVAGVIVHVAATVTYPHWPTSFAHPLYEVSLRALGEGLAAPSLGGALGLAGVAAVLPVFLAAAALVLWAFGVTPGRRAATTAVAVVLGVGLVFAYGGFARTKDPARPWSFVKGTLERP